jgi:hypothetical protein
VVRDDHLSIGEALGRLAAEMRGVDVREILGHGGGGERHNQGDGDQKLLHRGFSYLCGLGAAKGPNRLATWRDWNER